MYDPLMKHRAPVLILIGVISVVSILNWIHDYGAWMITPVKVVNGWEIALGGNLSSDVLATLATTLTAGFLHADGSHLGGNMLFLWLFGVVVCELCGWRWILTVFLLTTIGGSIGQLLLDPESPIPGLGASGGVMGLEGFYFGLAFLYPRPNSHVWPLARPVNSTQLAAAGVVGVGLDFLGLMGPASNVGHGAHIGGFVTGMLLSTLANRFIPR